MPYHLRYKLINYFIALVWLANGLFCKVLNLVPRHEQIVSKILNIADARLFTILIGISEIVMSVWILSGIKPRWNALAQIFIIGLMNALEFILVPNLLLWGRLNAVFAMLLMIIICYNEFINRKIMNTSTP
jgi:DoxX-like family